MCRCRGRHLGRPGPAAAGLLGLGGGLNGGLSPSPPRAARALHRVMLGLGTQPQPTSICVDSILSVARNTGPAPPQTLFVCSRSALPAGEGAGGNFTFKVVPQQGW